MKGNVEWAIEFMHDSLECGGKLRSLNIIDPYYRFCKGIFIASSIPAKRLIDKLEIAMAEHGKPEAIRIDNDPEFISKGFQSWLHAHQIKWEKIQKGSPQENCFIERFYRTAREELFNSNIFSFINEAKELAEEFVKEYNTERPHESLKIKHHMNKQHRFSLEMGHQNTECRYNIHLHYRVFRRLNLFLVSCSSAELTSS